MQADAIFAALSEDRTEIDRELVELGELDWQELADKNACRIALYQEGINFEDRDGGAPTTHGSPNGPKPLKQSFAERVKNNHLPDPTDAPTVAAGS